MSKPVTAVITILTAGFFAGILPVSAEAPASVSVIVSIADENAVLQLSQETITVTDTDEDGLLTIQDALILAHEQFYEGGAAAGYAAAEQDGVLTANRIWGMDTSTCVFYLNHLTAPALTAHVSGGDELYAVISDPSLAETTVTETAAPTETDPVTEAPTTPATQIIQMDEPAPTEAPTLPVTLPAVTLPATLPVTLPATLPATAPVPSSITVNGSSGSSVKIDNSAASAEYNGRGVAIDLEITRGDTPGLQNAVSGSASASANGVNVTVNNQPTNFKTNDDGRVVITVFEDGQTVMGDGNGNGIAVTPSNGSISGTVYSPGGSITVSGDTSAIPGVNTAGNIISSIGSDTIVTPAGTSAATPTATPAATPGTPAAAMTNGVPNTGDAVRAGVLAAVLGAASGAVMLVTRKRRK